MKNFRNKKLLTTMLQNKHWISPDFLIFSVCTSSAASFATIQTNFMNKPIFNFNASKRTEQMR